MTAAEMDIIIGADVDQAIAAFKKLGFEVKKIEQTAGKATGKMGKDFTGLSRVIQDLPFGFIAIQNNITQLLPAAGGLGLAFSALVSALTFLQVGFSSWTRGLGDNKNAIDEAVDAFEKLDEATKNLRDEIGETPTATEAATNALDGLKTKVTELKEQYEALGASIQVSSGFVAAGVDLALAQKQVQSSVQSSIDKTNQQITEGSKKLNDQRIAQAKADAIALGRVNMQIIENNAKLQIDADESILSNKKNSFSKRLAALRDMLGQQNIIIRTQLNKELSDAKGNAAKIAEANENYRFTTLKTLQDFNQKLDRLNKETTKKLREGFKTFDPEIIKIGSKPFTLIDRFDITKPIQDELDKKPLLLSVNWGEPGTLKAQAEALATQLNSILQNAIISMADSLGEAILGKGNIFDSLLGILGDSFQTLGKYIIAGTTLIASVSNALTLALKGFGGIGAGLALGAALIALGSVMKNIPKFATGGVVTKPTLALVGEQGPERITPLGYEGRANNVMQGEVVFQISGQSLRGILRRADQTAFNTF